MSPDLIIGQVVDSSIKIHSRIGPGCFERVYEECLSYELSKRGFSIERQLLMPIVYDDLRINNAYKLDILVEKLLIVEIKCVYELQPVHFKQLTTHLNLMTLKHGILLNFKTALMKEGIHRVFNNRGRSS